MKQMSATQLAEQFKDCAGVAAVFSFASLFFSIGHRDSLVTTFLFFCSLIFSCVFFYLFKEAANASRELDETTREVSRYVDQFKQLRNMALTSKRSLVLTWGPKSKRSPVDLAEHSIRPKDARLN